MSSMSQLVEQQKTTRGASVTRFQLTFTNSEMKFEQMPLYEQLMIII